MTSRRPFGTAPFSVLVALVLGGVGPAACSGSSADTSTGGDASASGDGATSGNDASASGDGAGGGNDGGRSGDGAVAPPGTRPIFVIPMENKAQTQIYGDTTDAPFINGTLLVKYPHTTNFNDELPLLPSEPHYVWMESGKNKFSDNTFSGDGDPTTSNSTASTDHLSAQLTTAGISWTSYQEGITAGTCPIASIGGTFYAAKHDPFVFFQDVSGSPPSATNANCIAHHKALTALAGDLSAGTAATYNFITPSLCNEMHGASGCASGTSDAPNIKAGDDWLKNNVQPIIDYALAHDGFVFITWDEGDSTNLIPFIAIGNAAIAAHAGSVMYTHSSLLKSEEEILGVPVLASVSPANDFSDLFTSFP